MAAKQTTTRKKATAPLKAIPVWVDQLPRLLAVAILLLYFFIRIGFQDIPIERDEGSYAYMGHLLLQGGTPYLDFYEMKPPALFYSYALLSGLSGGDLAWMHVWMAVFLFAGGMFLFYLVRRWLDDGAAVFAVLGYAALSMMPYASGFSIQAEHMVAVFAIAGLWALTKGLQMGTRRWIILSGILLCYGLLIKQNGIFFAALAITLVPFYHRTENPTQWVGNTLRDGGWLALGAAIPVAIFAVLMIIQGNLAEFWFWNVEYPKSYTSSISWDLGKTLLTNGLNKMSADQPVFWYLGGAGLVLIWMTRIAGWKKWAVSGFLLLAMVSVSPGKRFYGHYFLHFIPALAVASSAVVFALGRWLEPVTGRLSRLVLGPALATIVLLLTIANHESYYFRPNFTKILRTTYGSNPFPESKQLADYLNKIYQPGDGLVVFGSEPQLYAYTKAEVPTRHHFMGFLLKNHKKDLEWQEEVIESVTNDPPKYAVWVQHPLSWVPVEGADQTIINWGWQLVRQKYMPIAWYDQLDNGTINVVEGDAAKNYQAQGKQYMVLVERVNQGEPGNDQPPAIPNN